MTETNASGAQVPCISLLAKGCELCGDQPEIMHLHARCHLTAPLRAELEGGTLTLFCYLPECNRKVAAFKLANTTGESRGIPRTLDPVVGSSSGGRE